jgi:hypothetical protein
MLSAEWASYITDGSSSSVRAALPPVSADVVFFSGDISPFSVDIFFFPTSTISLEAGRRRRFRIMVYVKRHMTQIAPTLSSLREPVLQSISGSNISEAKYSPGGVVILGSQDQSLSQNRWACGTWNTSS